MSENLKWHKFFGLVSEKLGLVRLRPPRPPAPGEPGEPATSTTATTANHGKHSIDTRDPY
jgi:hypothetical protein